MDKRNLTHSTLLFLFFVFGQLCGQTKANKDNSPKYQIKERLGHPFGTILKLNVQIVDGESLRIKEHQSEYLLLVKKLDGKTIKDTLIIQFTDHSGHLPQNDFDLYWQTYNKKPNSITSDTSALMKKPYVGKEFDIMAYESGFFYGIPDGYLDFQVPRQEPSFDFRNYIVVISDLAHPFKDHE